MRALWLLPMPWLLVAAQAQGVVRVCGDTRGTQRPTCLERVLDRLKRRGYLARLQQRPGA